MGEKSAVIAYLAWLVGGWTGLHHFYLGRDRHAFVWWATCGGCFGWGWFRELWRIPEYVEDANSSHGYMEELKFRARRNLTPPFTTIRFVGELIMGHLMGYLLYALIPDIKLGVWLMDYMPALIAPVFVALGIHMVANIGRERVHLIDCLAGAYMTTPLLLINHGNVTYTALCCALYIHINNKKRWDISARNPRSLIKRLFILISCCSLYSALWFGVFAYNTSITTRDGEKILVKDAIGNFFTSPAWAETKKTLYTVYEQMRTEGFWNGWAEFMIQLDPEGETNAYRVLGVSSWTSEAELASAYRKLVRKYHPDKERDPNKRQEAEAKFMQIQQAYETLSSIKARRASKNKRSVRDKTEL